ncbi:MAG TPA: NUDIX domain-containing protein [Acidimicrobiales bacterium]|nr:NUDIX domain-containing protein [Acidimicrobiales bacterium]
MIADTGASRREVARIIVIDGAGQILLLRYQHQRQVSLDNPDLRSYWVAPGGAVDMGETAQQAAVRELLEETGLVVHDVGEAVWVRWCSILRHEKPVIQEEHFFVAVLTAESPDVANSSPEVIDALRWWSTDEIRSSQDTFFPSGLPDLVDPLIKGDRPPQLIRLEG